MSFHATKVFNTFEGGALVCRDAATKNRIDQLKNFGFESDTSVPSLGINGKMNEVSAAFGLLQLERVAAAVQKRGVLDRHYRQLLANVPGIDCMTWEASVSRNYAYFPILVRPEYGLARDRLYALLAEHSIFARRYFYPLISHFPMYRNLPSASDANLPVARAAAASVLCLPMSANLELADVERVVDVISKGAMAG